MWVQLELVWVQLKCINDLVVCGVISVLIMEIDIVNVVQFEVNYVVLMKQVVLVEDDLFKVCIIVFFDGMISVCVVNFGVYVIFGMEMLELVDILKMFLEGGVLVNNVLCLVMGQCVLIWVDGIDWCSFQGNIDCIVLVVVLGMWVLLVYVLIDNFDWVLCGGMFVLGELIFEQLDGIGILVSVIWQDGEVCYVLKIDGDRVV